MHKRPWVKNHCCSFRLARDVSVCKGSQPHTDLSSESLTEILLGPSKQQNSVQSLPVSPCTFSKSWIEPASVREDSLFSVCVPLFTDTLLVSAQSHHGPLGLAYSVLDKLDFLLLPQPLETLTLGDFAQTSSVFTDILTQLLPTLLSLTFTTLSATPFKLHCFCRQTDM